MQPDGDSLRQARADAMRMESESSTLAGFTQMHLRAITRMTATHETQLAGMATRYQQREAALLAELTAARQSAHERISELQQRLSDGCVTTYQSYVDMAALPAAVAGHGKALLDAQSNWLEQMRKPVEPRPTGAETAGDVVKHMFSELGNFAAQIFSNNPEMRQRAQRLLGGAIETGEGLTGKAGPIEPGEPEPAPVLDPAEARIDTLPLKEVFDLFQGLPAEVISGFAAGLKITEPFQANWRQMRTLLAKNASRATP